MQPSVSSGLVHLDEDQNIVLRISDKVRQKLIVKVGPAMDVYDLSGLICEEE